MHDNTTRVLAFFLLFFSSPRCGLFYSKMIARSVTWDGFCVSLRIINALCSSRKARAVFFWSILRDSYLDHIHVMLLVLAVMLCSVLRMSYCIWLLREYAGIREEVQGNDKENSDLYTAREIWRMKVECVVCVCGVYVWDGWGIYVFISW